MDESWLVRSGLAEAQGPLPDWYSDPVTTLGSMECTSVALDTTVAAAVQLMKENLMAQLPVVDAEG